MLKTLDRQARDTVSANRRDFLKKGFASAFLLGSGIGISGCSRPLSATSVGRAKNVIFLVSDGMSIGTMTAADHVNRKLHDRPTHWVDLYENNLVRRGFMDVAALNAIVTDSAASAAAWGCGHRVLVRALNIGPNGEEYTPVLPIFRGAGKGTGLVTTTRVTHATPAGFSANVEHRDMEDEIARQQAERNFDLILGGGTVHFSADAREDGADLLGQLRDRGYHVIHHRDELTNLPPDGAKVLGTFADGHLPYTLDHVNTPDLKGSVPSLAEMTRAALDRLSRNPNGFILQVEGGRVDHGAHGNDIGGLIFDQIAFDEAIGIVREFTDGRDDTLVILTTDHGNANPALNRSFNGYEETDEEFDRVLNLKHTNDWILSELSGQSSVEDIRDRVKEGTSIEITREQAEILRRSLNDEYEALYVMMSPPKPVLGTILANYLSFNWTGTSHTGDYVELAAWGPGSEALDGFTRNTALFDLMLATAGIEVAAG